MKYPHLSELYSTNSLKDKPVPRVLALVDTLERHSKSRYEESYVEQLRSSVRSLQEAEGTGHVTDKADQLKKSYLRLSNLL